MGIEDMDCTKVETRKRCVEGSNASAGKTANPVIPQAPRKILVPMM
jgi:hypothetical protein